MIEKITKLLDALVNALDSVRSFLEGSKTYLVSGLMIAFGLYYKDQQMVLEGLAIMSLRAGLAKMK